MYELNELGGGSDTRFVRSRWLIALSGLITIKLNKIAIIQRQYENHACTQTGAITVGYTAQVDLLLTINNLSTCSCGFDAQHIHSCLQPFHWCNRDSAVVWIPRLAPRESGNRNSKRLTARPSTGSGLPEAPAAQGKDPSSIRLSADSPRRTTQMLVRVDAKGTTRPSHWIDRFSTEAT